MSAPNETPFAGEYPTEAEAAQALQGLGFGEYVNRIVTIPMDGTSGPLAQELTRCKSVHLTQNWPIMFTAIVNSIVKEG